MFKSKNLLGEENKYLETIEECNRKIAKEIDLESSYASRGHAALMLGHKDKALDDYNRAIRLNPQHGWYYCMRAHLLLAQGENQKALEDATLAVKLHSPYAHNLRAILLMQAGQLKQALCSAHESLSQDASWINYYGRGQIYWKLRKPIESIEDFCTALSVHKSFKNITLATCILFALLVATPFSQHKASSDVLALWIISAVVLPMLAAVWVHLFYVKNAMQVKKRLAAKNSTTESITSMQLTFARCVSFLPLWRRFLPLALNQRGVSAAHINKNDLWRKCSDEEMEWYRKAGDIRGFARAHSRAIAYLNNLKDYDALDKLQNYSQNIVQTAYKEDATLAATYAKVLLEIATIQRLLQKYETSHRSIQSALTVQRENNSPRATQLPYEIFEGNILTKLGRLEEAEQILLACLKEAEQAPRAGNQNLFSCLTYIGNAYTVSNKLDLAEARLSEAQALGKENKFSAVQITLKRNLGFLKYKQHDYEAADAFLKDATSELEKKSGTDSPALLEVFKYHRALLQAQSREAELEQLVARMTEITKRYDIKMADNCEL